MRKSYSFKLALLSLLAIPTIASAEVKTDTIAFYETPNKEIASTGTGTGTNCTVSWSGLGSTGSNVYTNPTTGKYYNKYTSSSAYMQVSPTSKCKVGDIVTLTLNNSSAKSDCGCYLHSTSGNQVNAAMTEKDTEVEATYTLTSDDIEDDGSLKFFRISSNCRVHSYLVTRKTTVRTFAGFEIDLTQNPPTLPTGVEQVSYSNHGSSFNGATHGWCWYGIKFAVDGAVKITLGGCEYGNGNNGYVVDANGTTLATLENNTKACGCYHNGGKAEWTYNSNDAQTLTLYCGQYCPYIKVEPVEYQAKAIIKYYNTDGTKLGEEEVEPSSALAYKYSESDVTVETGKAFRGWFTSVGRKTSAGESITGDMSLYAKATDIEVPSETARFTYNLKNQYFYQEDHECITLTNNSYKDGTHGHTINNGTIALKVAGKAYIAMKVCKYSATGDAVVTDANGKTIGKFSVVKNTTTEDSTETVFYDGDATTLTITFTGTNYVHEVAIYNVKGEVSSTDGYYQIPEGDANCFIMALAQIKDGEKIYLPNGTYDLGDAVLTPVNANNVSIIGQSMDGTIIKNAPDVSTEGISTTATLLINSKISGTYIQDLTLENDLDYYKKNDGRAVCLQDKGTKTICKNVKLMSHQDTYYSNYQGAVKYFEGGEIHGTVDYICGDGSVYFNKVGLVCEKRQSTGGASDAVTASNAAATDKGYVFESCTLKYAAGMTAAELPKISLGRSWNNAPQCVFLNTTVDNTNGTMDFHSEKTSGTTTTVEIGRWTLAGMNVLPTLFGEYNTVDENGAVISPAENNVTFKYNGATKDMNTILSAENAAKYTMDYTLGDWAATAQADAKQVTEMPETGTFLVDGEITTTKPTSGKVRVANARGGFGPEIDVTGTAINEVENAAEAVKDGKYLINNQIVIVKDGKKFSVAGVELK